MSKTPDVGSADWINSVLEDAVTELMPLVDAVVELQTKDGYPPLTTALTLRKLLSMPLELAVAELEQALTASVVLDPVTGEGVVPAKMQKLAADFLDAVNVRTEGLPE